MEKQGYDPVEWGKIKGLMDAVKTIEETDPTVKSCVVTLCDFTDQKITLKIVTKRENERIVYRDYRRDSI